MLDGKPVRSEVFTFDVATAAVRGAREYQEDSLIANFPIGQSVGFTVLADGMGGHFSGHVASALVMSEAFAHLKMKEMLIEEGLVDIPETLHELAVAANDRVARHMEEDQETYGMGSTLLAVVIKGDALHWLSVGDSPLFLFRDGTLQQLNQDHSMAPQIDMMVAAGAMSAEKGRNHPDRNTLMSAVAGGKIEKIDCPKEPFQLQRDDILLTTSDGLQFLTNEKIVSILEEHRSQPAGEITNALLSALDELADPEQDNTAFSIIKLNEGLVLENLAGAAPTPAAVEEEGTEFPVEAVELDEVEAPDNDDTDEDVQLAEVEEDPTDTDRTPIAVESHADPTTATADTSEATDPTAETDDRPDPNQPRRVKLVKSEKLNFYRDPERAPKKPVEIEEPQVPQTVSVKSRLAALNGGASAEAVATKPVDEHLEVKVQERAPQEMAVDEETEETERKAYWYRGQKYYKD